MSTQESACHSSAPGEETSGTGRHRNQSQQAAPHSPCTPPPKRDAKDKSRPSAMLSVIVNRVDLFDSGCHKSTTTSGNNSDDEGNNSKHSHRGSGHQHSPMPEVPCPPVEPYRFEPPESLVFDPSHQVHHVPNGSVAIVRAPKQNRNRSSSVDGVDMSEDPNNPWLSLPVVDQTTPCPYGKELAKYWAQRRRLFRLFDSGIALDESGWYSVTPEQIADHTAMRVRDVFEKHAATNDGPVVILDAFCGCGGNTIAFAKLIPNAIVVAVEVNRSKLLMAANNARIYGIPSNKIIFCECNALFVLEHCYKNGEFVLDQPLTTPEAAMALMAAMPPPVESQVCVGGYQLGGIDVLPPAVHAVFMDPPWGGVDYNLFGKNGYDLGKNMWIERSTPCPTQPAPDDGSLHDEFFDSFMAAPMSKAERKAHFNSDMNQMNCVNGTELLMLAAAASNTHFVIFDLPRNINRGSLGQAALAAGYRGNCKLEEHFLNGRLKTVTAYFGSDWSSLAKTESVET